MNSKVEVILVLSLLVGVIALGIGCYNIGRYSDSRIDQGVIETALSGEYTGRGSPDELAVSNIQVISLGASDEMPITPVLTD